MPSMIKRGIVVAGLSLAAIVAASAASLFFAQPRSDAGRDARPASVTLIYVGAEDCAPCRVWRRDGWPQFTASSEFRRLAYREVVAPKLFQLLNDEHWPDDLRRYRDRLDRSSAVPLWFVVADDELALTARGLREWGERALPAIRSLLR